MTRPATPQMKAGRFARGKGGCRASEPVSRHLALGFHRQVHCRRIRQPPSSAR